MQAVRSDLEALFAPHGTVNSAHVFTDPNTGGSQGFGLVEMATEDQSHAAIAALNGEDSDGNTLTVNEDRPPEENGVLTVGAGTSETF
jgi:cold-inducible RNA-binding protein